MRITVSIPGDVVSRIDEQCEVMQISRSAWVSTACTKHLNDDAEGAHIPSSDVMILQERIEDLRQQVDYLKGEVSQWQGVASAFKELIPVKREGLFSRIRGYLTGTTEEQ